MWFPLPSLTLHNRLNDQRAKSKMNVSKRIFLHFMLLLCDFKQALAASAMNSENLVINSSPKEQKPLDAGTFVEYFKDHEISSSQARENLRNMRENDFLTPAYCKSCSAEHQKYCHSENLLKDHCCCNQSHNKGKFIDLEWYRFSFHQITNQGLHLIACNRFEAAPLFQRFLTCSSCIRNHRGDH